MVVDRSCYGDVLAASGVGTLHRIEGIMRKDDYNQIFEETFKKDARQLRLGWRCWFQHDNEPKHKAKVVTEWFNKAKINVLEWPSLSPNLNPIENLWRDIQRISTSWKRFTKKCKVKFRLIFV